MTIHVVTPASPKVNLRPRPEVNVGISALRGEPGPVGPSAYDVAVANGFTGTEAEWLAIFVDQDDLDQAIADHVVDPEPHPAYDDIPSLTLLFENGIA